MPNIAPFAFPYGRSGMRYVPVAKVPILTLRLYRYCEKVSPGYAMAVRMNRADRGSLRVYGC